MAVTEANMLRFRAVQLSRCFKELFAVTVPRGRFYRWLFRGENGELRRVGEYVLADLREFCWLDAPTIFDPDAMVMARREGRREVGLRIVNMLGLNETTVHELMRLDDGLS